MSQIGRLLSNIKKYSQKENRALSFISVEGSCNALVACLLANNSRTVCTANKLQFYIHAHTHIFFLLFTFLK